MIISVFGFCFFLACAAVVGFIIGLVIKGLLD